MDNISHEIVQPVSKVIHNSVFLMKTIVTTRSGLLFWYLWPLVFRNEINHLSRKQRRFCLGNTTQFL